MRNKIYLIVGILLAVILMAMPKVYALGITPGATTIQFEKGLQKNISLEVINSENKEMDVLLVSGGELSKYIKLDKDSLHFSSDEKRKSFTYELKLPESFEKPGKYSGEIAVVESSKATKGETVVGVALSVVSKLDVYVPYPKKYAELDLEIVEASQNETVRFFIPIINRGTEGINNAKVTIDIYSKNEKVASIETEETSLGPLERKELITEWLANAPQGEYKAIATLNYDGEIVKVEKEFNVGKIALDIIYVYVKDFRLGEIAKFNAILENKWGSEFKNVYFSITVYEKEGGVLTDFKSPTKEIFPQGKSEISAYWDTENVKAGTYDAKLEVGYGDRKIERRIEIVVEENAITIKGMAGYAIAKEEKGYITKKTLIVIIAVLLVVIVILLVVIKLVMRKRGKKEKKHGVEIIKKI